MKKPYKPVLYAQDLPRTTNLETQNSDARLNTCYYILLDDALDLISMYAPVSPQIVTVHRCTVRKDLIDVFSGANIMNSSLDKGDKSTPINLGVFK